MSELQQQSQGRRPGEHCPEPQPQPEAQSEPAAAPEQLPTVQRVHPTPVYELIGALIIAAILWKRGRRNPGEITGEYLVLSGLARFLVEFIRINPRIYFGMSNAQVASVGSMVIGILLIVWVRRQAAARAGQPAPAT